MSSSKDKPMLGPRDVDSRDNYIYALNEFYREDRDVMIEAGLVVLIGGLGRMVFKSDILGTGSMKKAIATFATVAAAGLVANRLKSMTPNRLASVIKPA